MALAESVLSVLREGDLFALFGAPEPSRFRGITRLILDVDEQRRPLVAALSHLTDYPRREDRWQVCKTVP
jgi:hypothetical protein